MRTKIALLLHDAPQAELIAERLAQFLGVSGATAAPEETHWAVRKLLEAMASRGPLIAIFNDLQWAEPALLDLLEHVADWSREEPILLLCLARPELLDARPTWGGGKLDATSFLLEPLTEAESEELISNLLERASVAPRSATRPSCLGALDSMGGGIHLLKVALTSLVDWERSRRWIR